VFILRAVARRLVRVPQIGVYQSRFADFPVSLAPKSVPQVPAYMAEFLPVDVTTGC